MKESKTEETAEVKNPDTADEKMLDELIEGLENPFHRKVIQAYRVGDSLKDMEKELGKILLEIMSRED